MTDNPCEACREDCLGGIIYGNCEQYRTWCKDNHYSVATWFDSRLPVQQGAPCQSRGK